MKKVLIDHLKREVSKTANELDRAVLYFVAEQSGELLPDVNIDHESLNKIKRQIRALHYKLFLEALAIHGVTLKK